MIEYFTAVGEFSAYQWAVIVVRVMVSGLLVGGFLGVIFGWGR